MARPDSLLIDNSEITSLTPEVVLHFMDTAKYTGSYNPQQSIFMFEYYLKHIHQTPYIHVLQIAIYLYLTALQTVIIVIVHLQVINCILLYKIKFLLYYAYILHPQLFIASFFRLVLKTAKNNY